MDHVEDIIQMLDSMAQAGVSRISIGVQSFREEELAAMGRFHTASSARRALRLLRDMDFGCLNVDLIYGASWLGYADYVKSGAYKSFDWDFVQTYMPLSAKNQAQSSWKEVEFDGLYYGITNDRCDVGWNGAWTTQALLD